MQKILVAGHSPHNPMGLFAETLEVFNQLLRSKQMLGHYDTDLAVEWGADCCYYHEQSGSNVFEYYFTPLFNKPVLPNTDRLVGGKIAGFYDEPKVSKCTWGPLSVHRNDKSRTRSVRQVNEEIWGKIFEFRPGVLSRLEETAELLVRNRKTIGTHRRTTDWGHGPIPPRTTVFSALDEYVAKGYDIYLSTDNNKEVDEFRVRYGDRVLCTDACRGTDDKQQPMFGHCASPAYHGYEAILDAFILSRTDVRLVTSSNLSTFAEILNPNQELDEQLQPTVHAHEYENGKYSAIYSRKYDGWPNKAGWGCGENHHTHIV